MTTGPTPTTNSTEVPSMSDSPSRIINKDGQLRNIQGRTGVEAYRLKVMKVALLFWKKTGMQPTRGVKILKLAKETTGLHTNDVAVLAAKLDEMTNEKIALCEVATLETRGAK